MSMDDAPICIESFNFILLEPTSDCLQLTLDITSYGLQSAVGPKSVFLYMSDDASYVVQLNYDSVAFLYEEPSGKSVDNVMNMFVDESYVYFLLSTSNIQQYPYTSY